MINYNRLGYEIKRDFTNFATKISHGLKRPQQKFVHQMIYGILAGNKVHLSEIARSLKEDITLVKRHIKEDYAVIVIDNSDIAKPASRKLEAPSEIRDGSTGEITQGYLTIEAAVLSESGKMPLPVYEKVFSAAESGFVSETYENLRMTYDKDNDHYFLKESTDSIKGYTNKYPTANSHFFPFDDADTSGNTNSLNYGFGMKMEINFRLTPDGTIIKDTSGNSQDITFNFSGDDDIWIFIDGKLALDMGGSHGPRTVDEMIQLASGVGFIMRQESISDYGSVTSGKAEPANGAKYNLFARGSNGSETLVAEDSRVANNVIGLKDKQLAKLTNKFRRGSYIVVTEKTSSMMKTLSGLSGDAAEQLLTDVFDTKYTIYSKDVEVSQADLQGDTYWVKGSSLSSLKDRPGVAANDGRTEKFPSGASDMNGTPITHTTITEMPENAILFRNYIDTDSETIEMDLRVKYTNSFKTGAIAITKA